MRSKILLVVGLLVVGIIGYLGYVGYLLNKSDRIHQKLIEGTPTSTATLVPFKIKTQGFSYSVSFFYDAVDLSGTRFTAGSAQLARPGITDISYVLSLKPSETKRDCSVGALIVPYKVTLATGIYSVCTTAKAPAMVMNFKDTHGNWHNVSLFAVTLRSLPNQDPILKQVFSSISVE